MTWSWSVSHLTRRAWERGTHSSLEMQSAILCQSSPFSSYEQSHSTVIDNYNSLWNFLGVRIQPVTFCLFNLYIMSICSIIGSQ